MSPEETKEIILKITRRTIDSLKDGEPTLLAILGILRAVVLIQSVAYSEDYDMTEEHEARAEHLCVRFLESLTDLHSEYDNG